MGDVKVIKNKCKEYHIKRNCTLNLSANNIDGLVKKQSSSIQGRVDDDDMSEHALGTKI